MEWKSRVVDLKNSQFSKKKRKRISLQSRNELKSTGMYETLAKYLCKSVDFVWTFSVVVVDIVVVLFHRLVAVIFEQWRVALFLNAIIRRGVKSLRNERQQSSVTMCPGRVSTDASGLSANWIIQFADEIQRVVLSVPRSRALAAL